MCRYKTGIVGLIVLHDFIIFFWFSVSKNIVFCLFLYKETQSKLTWGERT